MKVHVLQHASFEGLGNAEAWLRERDARIGYSRLDESPALPGVDALDDIDLLVSLGGPMSVNDEAILPWLAPEKRLIAAAIERGVAVLGVCLGAQLIAASQGARVYPGEEKEIGWHRVSAVPPVPQQARGFQFPEATDVFHWHGETFDLPVRAVHLARSAGCEHQAFQLGSRVIGLQFHLEVTRDSVSRMLEHGQGDLTESRYVQTSAEIRAAADAHYASVQMLMHRVLDYLTA